jgi:hypothetical protein
MLDVDSIFGTDDVGVSLVIVLRLVRGVVLRLVLPVLLRSLAARVLVLGGLLIVGSRLLLHVVEVGLLVV